MRRGEQAARAGIDRVRSWQWFLWLRKTMLYQTESRAKRIQTETKIQKLKRLLKQTNPEARLCALGFDSPLQMKRDTKISGASLNGLLPKPWFQDGLWPPLLPPSFIVKVKGRSLRIFSHCSFSRPALSLSISIRWEQQQTQKPLCL